LFTFHESQSQVVSCEREGDSVCRPCTANRPTSHRAAATPDASLHLRSMQYATDVPDGSQAGYGWAKLLRRHFFWTNAFPEKKREPSIVSVTPNFGTGVSGQACQRSRRDDIARSYPWANSREPDDDPSPRERCGDELSVLRMRCRRRSVCPAEPDAPRFPIWQERCSSAGAAAWRR
jgi:hypothetical protein